jgi:hypothetical protein
MNYSFNSGHCFNDPRSGISRTNIQDQGYNQNETTRPLNLIETTTPFTIDIDSDPDETHTRDGYDYDFETGKFSARFMTSNLKIDENSDIILSNFSTINSNFGSKQDMSFVCSFDEFNIKMNHATNRNLSKLNNKVHEQKYFFIPNTHDDIKNINQNVLHNTKNNYIYFDVPKNKERINGQILNLNGEPMFYRNHFMSKTITRFPKTANKGADIRIFLNDISTNETPSIYFRDNYFATAKLSVTTLKSSNKIFFRDLQLNNELYNKDTKNPNSLLLTDYINETDGIDQDSVPSKVNPTFTQEILKRSYEQSIITDYKVVKQTDGATPDLSRFYIYLTHQVNLILNLSEGENTTTTDNTASSGSCSTSCSASCSASCQDSSPSCLPASCENGSCPPQDNGDDTSEGEGGASIDIQLKDKAIIVDRDAILRLEDPKCVFDFNIVNRQEYKKPS